MDIEDVEIGGLVLLNGKVVRVLSIHSCNGIIERINQIPVFNFKPWTPTLDDQGRIIWPGGDYPLFEGEKAYVWFKEGSNFDELGDESSCSDEKNDWDHSGSLIGRHVTHFKPIGKAAERLLGSIESSEIAEGDFVTIDNGKEVVKYLPTGTVCEVLGVTNYGVTVKDIDGKTRGRSFDCIELYATAAEHQTYLDTEVPEGYEKLPFDDGGWGVPVEGDLWLNRAGISCSFSYGDKPDVSINDGKRVIVRKIEGNEPKQPTKLGHVSIAASRSPTAIGTGSYAVGNHKMSTANEPPEEGAWIPHTTNEMPIGGDELVQIKTKNKPESDGLITRADCGLTWVDAKENPITHYRVLPPLPEGEEHEGRYDFPKKGEPFLNLEGGVSVSLLDFVCGDDGKRWILKPRPSTAPDGAYSYAVGWTDWSDLPASAVAKGPSGYCLPATAVMKSNEPSVDEVRVIDVINAMEQKIVQSMGIPKQLISNQGEDMPEKTNEELLKEAPEQIGYERSVGVPRTGRFRKDLFYSPIDRKITKRDDLLTSRRGGRRVIYRKKKSKLRKTFDVATFIPRWSLANTWKPALGATFLLGATTCAVGCAAHFLGYQFDPSVLVESARSAVEGLNQ